MAKASARKLKVTPKPSVKVERAILKGLSAYNDSHIAKSGWFPFAVAVEDGDGKTIGGLWGEIYYQWLFIKLLYLPETMRRRGRGTALMRKAEEEALRHGCRGIWLDTFSFQARGFYERLGYEMFGKLDDYPDGHTRFFMKKRLG